MFTEISTLLKEGEMLSMNIRKNGSIMIVVVLPRVENVKDPAAEQLIPLNLKGNDFLIGEVFFIPIAILNKTEGAFRDIILSFFQVFYRAHHFPKKEDLYDYEVIVDYYMEERHEYDNDPERWNFIAAKRRFASPKKGLVPEFPALSPPFAVCAACAAVFAVFIVP
jgi:hypothetical protein